MSDLASRLWQGMANLLTPQPAAYTRITRTPVYVDPNMPAGQAGGYGAGKITIAPDHWDTLPHEQAHVLYDQAHLVSQAPELAPAVPELKRQFIQASPIYNQQPGAGNAEQLSDEGLGFSIGDPTATDYVEKVARKIKDPAIAARLRRLNDNAIATRFSREDVNASRYSK